MKVQRKLDIDDPLLINNIIGLLINFGGINLEYKRLRLPLKK